MSEFLSKFTSNDLIIGVFLLSCLIVGLTSIIAGCVVKVLKSNSQTKLKQDMIARGMSADEIKTVLEAGHKK